MAAFLKARKEEGAMAQMVKHYVKDGLDADSQFSYEPE